MSTNIVGKDIWWDTRLQEFRQKRINLTKVPSKFRCPNCGKIVVKPKDREPLIIRDEQDREIKNTEVKRLLKLEKPPHSEWNEFVDRHKELFDVKTIDVPRNSAWWLSFYGGVCQDCWLDGFGRFGDYGGFVGRQIRPKEEERRLNREKWEREKLAKYGEEPKYWLDPGFTKNPAWQEWWDRHVGIDNDEKRRKNATFVESIVVELEEEGSDET